MLTPHCRYTKGSILPKEAGSGRMYKGMLAGVRRRPHGKDPPGAPWRTQGSWFVFSSPTHAWMINSSGRAIPLPRARGECNGTL